MFKTPSHEYMQQHQTELGPKTTINSSFDQTRSDVLLPKTKPVDGAPHESQIQHYKSQADSAKENVAKLEMTLKSKETEVGKLRVDLAATKSQLEQSQIDLKKKNEEASRTEGQVAKLQLEIDNKTNKVIIAWEQMICIQHFMKII